MRGFFDKCAVMGRRGWVRQVRVALVVMSVAFVVAAGCGASRAGRSALVRTARPVASSTPLSRRVVDAYCVSRHTDMRTLGSAYVHGWLLCTQGDRMGAEGVALFREAPRGSGRFRLVAGGGGAFLADDLARYGVSADDAAALVVALRASEAGDRASAQPHAP
jgi:hypothetical protein